MSEVPGRQKDDLPAAANLNPSTADIKRAAIHEYASSLGHLLRLALYKYSKRHNTAYDDPNVYSQFPGVTDIHHAEARYLYDYLNVGRYGRVVDIGCGDGGPLLNLAINYNHMGELIGINNSAEGYEYGKEIYRQWRAQEEQGIYPEGQDSQLRIPALTFIEADAQEKLPIEPGSADVATVNFVAYHLTKPERAFANALEVLRPGGMLVAATRGEENHRQLWQNCQDMADFFVRSGISKHVEAPVSYYRAYDIQKLDQNMAKRGLRPIIKYDQDEELLIPADALDLYLQAHEVLKNLFKLFDELPNDQRDNYRVPTKKEMDSAIDAVARKRAEDHIRHTGFAQDWTQQSFRIYQKPANYQEPQDLLEPLDAA
jgi:SAM-dependent methyltransferase